MLTSFDDRYDVITQIGEGSFSEVLQVQDKETSHQYAAKRLTRPFANVQEVESYSELITLKALTYHPNVLCLVDYVYEASIGALSLIFNLMDMSLYDFIKDRKRKLSEGKCKNYLCQILMGIEHLHRSGIFHRDIKPENILVHIDKNLQKCNPEKAELIQIADLGSVAYISNSPPRSEYVSTRWYRAPECILTSGFYGHKADIWAVGCVFYEILTLQPIFPGDNEIDQMMRIHKVLGSPTEQMLKRFKHLSCHVKFPREPKIELKSILTNVTEYGLDILKRMLTYHPDNRPTAAKLLDHIYLTDIRRIMASSIHNRLLYTFKTESNVRQSNITQISSHVMNKLKQMKEKQLKQRERGWNMNPCPEKKIIEYILSPKGGKRV